MLLLLFIAATVTSYSATIIVDDNINSGAGSLRQAIADANPGDTVIFDPSVRGEILLNTPGSPSLGGELLINKSLTIIGPGADVLNVRQEGNGEQRVFHITAGNVSISGLTISNGGDVSYTSNGGGGILIDSSATLSLNNCTITRNASFNFGGGGGIENRGTLLVTNSSITKNSATHLIPSNSAAGITNYGTITMTNSTVAGNTAFVDSFGVGGLRNSAGTANLLNCTIAENVGAGGDSGGVQRNAGTVTVKNTIIGKNFLNTGTLFSNDVNGVFSSQGNNLIENTNGGSGFLASDILDVNPQLGTLAKNGGTTNTVAILSGSPAINAGNNTGAPAMDQRGVARPQGGTIDVGAYESGVKPAAFGKIVFVSDRDGNREIYTMNPDGTNQTRLTFNSAFEGDPRWSPDGTKIVFTSDRDGQGTLRIYVMNADGSNPTLLTLNSFGVGDTEPSWSPDGSKIVFSKTVITSPPTPHIYSIGIMNADGSNQTGILGSAVPNLAYGTPIFSPDGSKIIYSHIPNSSSTSDIFSVDLNGSNETQITSGNRNNFEAALSPDGDVIALRRDTNGSGALRIYLIDLPSLFNLGVDLRPFISPQINQLAFNPAWSPDGTKLIYHTSSSFLGGDLYVRDADGSSPVLILDQTNSGNGKTIEADWFGRQTPTGSNVTSVTGTVSATFGSITSWGTTTAVPIDPTTAGTLPGGYTFGAGYPAYEITTTASYTAPITVCLQVPSATVITTFNALTLFHTENGILVDRTSSRDFATKTICAIVSSLSPFAVAQNLAPTAANVSVGGRVLDVNGKGVSRARVLISNQAGEVRGVVTNSFGYYRFDEIPAGETYIFSAFHKEYQFNSQIIAVSEDIRNADFTAQP